MANLLNYKRFPIANIVAHEQMQSLNRADKRLLKLSSKLLHLNFSKFSIKVPILYELNVVFLIFSLLILNIQQMNIVVLLFTLNKYSSPGKSVCFTEIIKKKKKKQKRKWLKYWISCSFTGEIFQSVIYLFLNQAYRCWNKPCKSIEILHFFLDFLVSSQSPVLVSLMLTLNIFQTFY